VLHFVLKCGPCEKAGPVVRPFFFSKPDFLPPRSRRHFPQSLTCCARALTLHPPEGRREIYKNSKKPLFSPSSIESTTGESLYAAEPPCLIFGVGLSNGARDLLNPGNPVGGQNHSDQSFIFFQTTLKLSASATSGDGCHVTFVVLIKNNSPSKIALPPASAAGSAVWLAHPNY
jgi:hypothetical protein